LNEEHIIGVKLLSKFERRDYDFTIAFNYSEKPLILSSGLLNDFII